MKSIFEIPEVDLDPACMERIARAYSQLQTMEKKLEPVRAKTADFNSRRASAAEKVKTAREKVDEAQRALQLRILQQRDANGSALKSARSEFNNSLAVLKGFHRELERLDNVERVDLERETNSVKQQYAEAERELWKAVNEAETARFAELARHIVHRLHASKIKTLLPGSPMLAFEKYAIDLLAHNGVRIDPEDILQDYVDK